MIYNVTIRVRLDEDDQEAANRLANEIARSINDESFTNCAEVVDLSPERMGLPAPGVDPFDPFASTHYERPDPTDDDDDEVDQVAVIRGTPWCHGCDLPRDVCTCPSPGLES